MCSCVCICGQLTWVGTRLMFQVKAWETSVDCKTKAIPHPPPTYSTLCWWFPGISATHCWASLLKGIGAAFPSTIEPPCSKGGRQTGSIVTREQVRNTQSYAPTHTDWIRACILVKPSDAVHTEAWGPLLWALRSDLLSGLIIFFLWISIFILSVYMILEGKHCLFF